MIISNFRLRNLIYRLVLTARQLVDAALLHPARERAVRALRRTVDYIESNMGEAIGLGTPQELLAYALSECRVEGHFLEFGVFKGDSLRFLARRRPGATFHGFDSFQGLPERWAGFSLRRGALSAGGRIPRIPGNVRLHVGWFADTLPAWRRECPGPVAFIHIDCDLYSSTVEALHGVADRLQPGTIVVFDEYFNYPNWENHEFRAWQEFLRARGLRYEYLAFARFQAAVRIVAPGAPAA